MPKASQGNPSAAQWPEKLTSNLINACTQQTPFLGFNVFPYCVFAMCSFTCDRFSHHSLRAYFWETIWKLETWICHIESVGGVGLEF